MMHATVISQRLLVCYKRVLCNVPVMNYVRGRHPANRSNHKIDFDDPEVHRLIEEEDEMEDFDQFAKAEVSSNDISKIKKKITFKTIEQKYFRPPKEVNLLTWDAKQQIYYLHQEFPNEWTLEKLAQSFPISVEGLQKLVKSLYRPKNMGDIIKHDRNVHKTWKELKLVEKGKLKSGPIVNRYEMLQKNNQLHLLGKADGYASLPNSDWKQKFLSQGREVQTFGKYGSIIADYYKLKGMKDELVSSMPLNEKQEQMLTDHLLSNKLYLQSITKNMENLSNAKEIIEKSQQMLDSGNNDIKPISDDENDAKHDVYDASNDDAQIEGRLNSIKRKRLRKRAMDDEDHRSMVNSEIHNEIIEKNSISTNNQSSMQNLNDINISLEDQIRVGMEGTQKVDGKTDHSESQMVDESTYDKNLNDLQQEGAYWVNEMKERSDVDNGTTVMFYEEMEDAKSVPYMYHPEKGYQFPYGNRRLAPKASIDPPKLTSSTGDETVLFQSGKEIYDEDGEFLYRIP